MTDVLTEVESDLEADASQVARFVRNRAWLALAQALRVRQSAARERLVKAMFRKGADPVDQREVDYARGVIDTIDFFLGLPDQMQRRADAER